MSEPQRMTHVDDEGRARMVDVGAKPVSARRARARGEVHLRDETLERLRARDMPKGDVLEVARLAGIQAAKQTAQLIPLCHVLPLDHVDVEIRHAPERGCLVIEATAACRAATGVEMEAVVAVLIAAATIYDMCKSVDRGMRITDVELIEKSGGRSGTWTKPQP